ncbi:MAG: hypothetical protein CBB71_16855 [Rhodopirellula sp. TMED11]|nr:MAG: hypothetical protein CBB71_16855 [Rhodopirellula sp. TMED11]
MVRAIALRVFRVLRASIADDLTSLHETVENLLALIAFQPRPKDIGTFSAGRLKAHPSNHQRGHQEF